MSTEHDHAHGVWVESDVATDNSYVCTVHVSEDVSIPLTSGEAAAYALALVRQATHATYDAAVAAQISHLTEARGPEVTDHAVAVILKAIRAARPNSDGVTTGPVTFHGIVSAMNREPYVNGSLNGEHFTRWTPALAMRHALHVMEVAVAAELDGLYRTALMAEIGVKSAMAMAMVDDLYGYVKRDDDV